MTALAKLALVFLLVITISTFGDMAPLEKVLFSKWRLSSYELLLFVCCGYYLAMSYELLCFIILSAELTPASRIYPLDAACC